MIEILINQFKDLTTLQWIGQICGYIAYIIYVISTQLSKKKFLYLSLFVFTFFALEQSFAQLYGGIITNFFSLVRSVILLVLLKKGKEKMPSWVNYLLIGLLWFASTTLFIIDPSIFKGAINCFLPLFLATVFALSLNSKNYIVTKLGILVNELGYFIFYLFNRLPLSYIREIVLLIAVVYSIIKEVIKQKRARE